MIKLDVLGPLRLRYRGKVIRLQPKQCLVILALMCADGPVNSDRLMHLLWDRPTPGSEKTLRTHISRARKAVIGAGGSGEDLIATIELGGGRTVYRLANGLDIDALRFQQLVAAGCQAFRQGRIDDASAQLSAALASWQGQPLAEASGRPFALGHVQRLEDIYQTAVITQLKAWISLGQHREAVSELSLLTQRWPGEGEVWELLITALYRSDRGAEASNVCRRAIDAMRAEGLDDSLFQQLQRDMLNGLLPKRGLLAA